MEREQELEQRIVALEKEVRILKTDIQRTLLDIRSNLPERGAATSSARWQKHAWMLALVNVIMAVVLFTNVYLYLPGNMPFDLNPTFAGWLRAFWVALAFLWLVFQMYPLALLLAQEDEQWQNVGWRNALRVVRARPGLLVGLTLAVLVVALVNVIVPAAWLVVGLALLVGLGGMAVRGVLDMLRAQVIHSKG